VPIKAFHIVKLSPEIKVFEFPFIFGKMRGNSKPMKRKK
jgi:hypothetical protein